MKIRRPTRNNGPLLRRVSPLAVVSFILLVVPTACMSEPGDGEVVGIMSNSNIGFAGWTQTPNEKIYIEYYSHFYRDWRTAGTARTRTDFTPSWAGNTWYPWNKTLSSPRGNHWERGRWGGKLRIRARPESGIPTELWTMVPDFLGCWSANVNSPSDFLSECIADSSPEAVVISQDFCDSEVRRDYGEILPRRGDGRISDARWEWIDASFSDSLPAGRFLFTAMGEIATNPRVGSAQCWSPSPSSGSGDTKRTNIQCTGIGSNGVFRNTNEAVAWLEGDCTPQGCNRTINYRWDYAVPFGRCERTAGLGVLKFSDYYEGVLAGFFLADEDFDGILDLDDDCRTEPEDFDNYLDSDGCPEQAPQPPACFVMPGDILCGTGAAPTGFVVTDLTYRPDCCGVNGGGCNNQGVNARRVTPYTGVPSGFGCELRICTGYDAPPPPAWSVVNSSVPTLACQGSQLVARKQ